MTLGDLKTYVADRLQIPSSDSAKLTQIQSIANLETARANVEFEATIASASATITATTGLVTLPSDFQRLITLTHDSVLVQMTNPIDFALRATAIAAGTSPTVTNPPTIAMYRTPSTLATLPAPTANVSATLVYVQRPAVMTSDATTIPLPVELHDFVAESAVRRMALTEGESAIAQISLDIMNELRVRYMALRNQQMGPSSWQIPLTHYTTAA